MFGNRSELQDYVQKLFINKEFSLSGQCNLKSTCFDFMARKDALWLIKVLINIDSLQQYHADELKLLSDLFSGTPLLVGEKTHREPLEDGVVYKRYSVPAVNPPTLASILFHEFFPKVFAKRGGLYARILGETLRERREEENLSRAQLAEKIGVSERTIMNYERGTMDASKENLLRLEKILDTDLSLPINLSEYDFGNIKQHIPAKIDDFEQNIQEKLLEIGFDVFWTEYTPFDAVTKEKEKETENEATTLIIAGVGHKSEKNIKKRVQITGSISDITRKIAMFVLEGSSTRNIEGVPIMRLKELSKFETPNELKRTIKKRKGSSS
ncbi:MAG: transcriptional regulator [Candidatus Lokiarchaeota archaeon]|nr:transcriptional regulator [Candidatus Lokiarchaeota archaeon]